MIYDGPFALIASPVAMDKWTRNTWRCLVRIVGRFMTILPYSEAYYVGSFHMDDYSFSHIFLSSYPLWFVRSFLTICR